MQATTETIIEAESGIPAPITENIPEQLRERPQWVIWRFEQRDGKWTKVPYSPITGDRASTTDLMTWARFEEAMIMYLGGEYDGIGFAFCSADPYVGIDFDKCRNPETGKVDEEVLGIIRSFKSVYAEVSVSGTGVHLVTTGKCREGKKKGGREVYGQDRFFVMTGEVLDV